MDGSIFGHELGHVAGEGHNETSGHIMNADGGKGGVDEDFCCALANAAGVE
jgi:hypothetical protein